MRIADLHQVRWFRSKPVASGFSPDKVDAELGVLHDVVIAQEGEAKGHGVNLDEIFISNLVAFGQEKFGQRGVKARLGHPSASDDTMGKQMGFFRNFRKRKVAEKMQAVADLHLLEASELSPTSPNMRSWVLKMAVEAPDFIMSSIVFRGSGFFQKKANGHRKAVEKEDDYDTDQPLFIEFDPEKGAALYYTDLVESGAATENLFSTTANPDFFISRALAWLGDNPDILNFLQQNPQRLGDALQRLGFTEKIFSRKMEKFSLKNWLFGDEKPIETTEPEFEKFKSDLREEMQAMKSGVEALQEKCKNLEQQNIASQKVADELKNQLAAANDRVIELEKTAATPPAGGESDPTPPTSDDAPLYMKSAATREAMAWVEKKRRK